MLSEIFCVGEKNEKIFFWDGDEIVADYRFRAIIRADFRGDCRVNVCIMTS